MVKNMITVEMIKVKSSNLSEIGYDEKQATLFIKFHGVPEIYQYINIPPIIFMALKECRSKGTFLASQVIPFFKFRRIAIEELNTKVVVH